METVCVFVMAVITVIIVVDDVDDVIMMLLYWMKVPCINVKCSQNNNQETING
jgi:hypothetical protein